MGFPGKNAARTLLAHFPALRREIRRTRQQLRYWRQDHGPRWQTLPNIGLQTPWEWAGVEPRKGDLFFGYYDKCPWSVDGERMVLHGRPDSRGRWLDILVFDRRSHSVRTIGRTTAWNVQQGSMTQWLGSSGHVIFNAVRNGLLSACITDVDGHELSAVPYPVQTVHPNGLEALSLNYRRLWKYRAEYGYNTDVQNYRADFDLHSDGLWQVDLRSGSGRLIVTLDQLFAISPRPDMNRLRTKVNHAIVAPSGQRVIFMHRWFTKTQKVSRLYLMDWDGSGLRLILDSNSISHYHWRDETHVVIYGNTPEGDETYFILNVMDGTFERIGADMMRFGDGHPTYSPAGGWFVTDCYPDAQFKQHLFLYELATQKWTEIGSFLHPPCFDGPTRCDLHPRWSRDGTMVSFDSVWPGVRSSFLVNVAGQVRRDKSSDA
jgi:hypothetical protein